MAGVLQRSWKASHLVGGPAYLDSSVTVAWLTKGDQFNSRAVAFAGDQYLGKVEMVMSLLTVDETLWRLTRGMVVATEGCKLHEVALVLKRKPGALKPHIPRLRQAIDYLLTWALLPVGASPLDVVDAWLDRLSVIAGIHDAQHLAHADLLGARSFVTCDRDFRRVRTLPRPLTIYTL